LVTHEKFEDLLTDEVNDEEDWETFCLAYKRNRGKNNDECNKNKIG